MGCFPWFLCVLLFMRDVQHCFKREGPAAFVDALCINQETDDTKRRGIEKLGAFLKKSEKMVALYTDVYLLKLWTVFELASFLAIHNIKDLVILPVAKTRAF